MEKRIDELVNQHFEYADQMVGFLQSVIAQVSDGKLPESYSAEDYTTLLNRIENSYQAVQDFAGQVLRSDEMPEAGCSVADFKDAVLNSESMKFQNELKEYSDKLRAFLYVTSNSPAFADVLAPYQQDTQRILQEIETGDISNLYDKESLLQELEGPASFLQALTYPDFDSEESMSVLEKVFENYPSRKIQMGISTGKYYVDASFEQMTTADEMDTTADEMDSYEMEAVEQDSFEMEAPEPDSFEMEVVEPDSFEMEPVEQDSFEMEAPEPDSFEMEAPDLDSFEMEAPEPDSFEMEPADADSLEMGAVELKPTVDIDDIASDPSARVYVDEQDILAEDVFAEAEPVAETEAFAEAEPDADAEPVAEEEEAVFCIHCGTKIEPDYKFCIGCGSPASDSLPV